MTDKQPRITVRGHNIEPETFGELAVGMLTEYVTVTKSSTFATEIGDDRRFQRAAIGSILESLLILTANKMGLDLIDMLGILERTKGNVLKQVDAQQSRQLYERAKKELDQQAREADPNAGPALPGDIAKAVAGKIGGA